MTQPKEPTRINVEVDDLAEKEAENYTQEVLSPNRGGRVANLGRRVVGEVKGLVDAFSDPRLVMPRPHDRAIVENELQRIEQEIYGRKVQELIDEGVLVMDADTTQRIRQEARAEAEEKYASR